MPHVVHLEFFDGLFNLVVGVSAGQTLLDGISHVHFSALRLGADIVNALVDLFIVRHNSALSIVGNGRLGRFNQANGLVDVTLFNDISQTKFSL